MLQSRSEQLTAHFYEWEQRGRGWPMFDEPVDLEPPFHPFFGHVVTTPQTVDDSKRPTLISTFADLFRNKPEPLNTSSFYDIPPIEPYLATEDAPLVAIGISLPKGQKIEIEETEKLLVMLSASSFALSFEIIATDTAIQIQIICREPDILYIRSQVKAYFPTAALTEKGEAGLGILTDDYTCRMDFGLQDEFMRPLAMTKGFDPDPLLGLFGILDSLQEGERGIVQILFQGTINPWVESMMRSVTDSAGGSFFADDPDMVKFTKEKVSQPLFAVCIRVVGQAPNIQRATTIAETVGIALQKSTHSQSNALIPLSYAEYVDDVAARNSHRLGMLLNCRELVTLVHFPAPSIVSSKVERDTRKTKIAPAITQGHEFVLGTNTHQGTERVVTVSSSQRLRHTHIIGATGTGKSTFLQKIIIQDIDQGHGIAVLDPHGDLIDSIVSRIPENRVKDIVVIDPSDAEFPIGFNILSAHSEIEKEILSSDLVAAFKRLSTSWGDQMNSVLANAILAFLESSEGGTLSDLRRFLIEPHYRATFLKTVSDPNIIYYWQKSFTLLKSNALGPIVTRLDAFLRPKLIRNMVAQRKSLDFENLMDSKKILLIKLSQGLIGAENSYLLGTFFVSKIYQAALARQAVSKADRSDFFLYIDEFQNFITPSMSGILSGARKYHLGLILAHQDMQQLIKYDTELASSVIANPGTRICFRVGDIDAKKFEDGFSYFTARDLQDLKTGEAIVRIDRPDYDFNISITPLPEIDPHIAEQTKNAVIAYSRELYGTPKGIVEKSQEYLRQVVLPQEKLETPKVKKEQPTQMSSNQEVHELIQSNYTPIPKTETEHRYLQTLIKRMAESRGYKASIEEPTPDGRGRVDVSLERDEKKIAVEISVTTPDLWEIHNVEKCLAAGYDIVIVCSNDAKNLEKIKRQIEKLTVEQQVKVWVLNSDEVFQYFNEQIAQQFSIEKVVKGYRVKVKYDTLSPEEMTQKQANIVKAVTNSIKKKKKG